jgi:hypothetical protein
MPCPVKPFGVYGSPPAAAVRTSEYGSRLGSYGAVTFPNRPFAGTMQSVSGGSVVAAMPVPSAVAGTSARKPPTMSSSCVTLPPIATIARSALARAAPGSVPGAGSATRTYTENIGAACAPGIIANIAATANTTTSALCTLRVVRKAFL